MHAEKDWVHLSRWGAKPSDQKKQELELSGNFSFGVRTAWTVVCCWEFLAQQTVWSLEGGAWGEHESSGTADRRGQLPSEWVPLGSLHSAGLPQLKSAVLGTSRSTFLCLNVGISQADHRNCTGKLHTSPTLRASSWKFCTKVCWGHWDC